MASSETDLDHGGDYEECSVLQLLVTAYVVPSSLILSTLMMDVVRSLETSVITRATRRNIPEDGILHRQQLYVTVDRTLHIYS
jgi:hypothetical protein